MTIRQTTASDVAALTAIAERAFDAPTSEKVNKAVTDFVQGRFTQDSSVFTDYVTLETDGQVRGMCGVYTLRWVGPQVRYLGWFFIDPESQGKGYGKALLAHAIQSAKDARWLMVETESEATLARRLYQQMGFKDLAQVPDYWPNGDTLVLMGLRLGSE